MPDQVIERAPEVVESKLPTAVPREPRGTRAAFSAAYADQTERDHNVLAKAARNRRIAVERA